MKEKEQAKKEIINHISRLEGQLASIKKELFIEEPNCTKASTTMLSAARSFATLRQRFIESFLLKHFITSIPEKDQAMFTTLLSITKG